MILRSEERQRVGFTVTSNDKEYEIGLSHQDTDVGYVMAAAVVAAVAAAVADHRRSPAVDTQGSTPGGTVSPRAGWTPCGHFQGT
jgi:hypothetical protein